MGKIPWIPEDKMPETAVPLPINTEDIAKFLKSSQILESLYKSLEETFWVIIGLESLEELPGTAHKALISYVLKHRIDTGGYSSKLDGNSADVWSTFYAIALLDLVGVFEGQLGDRKVFCPNTKWQKQAKQLNMFLPRPYTQMIKFLILPPNKARQSGNRF